MFAFQTKINTVCIEILDWLTKWLMQMEWKSWPSQQNMAKLEINVQKHIFLDREFEFWLKQIVVIKTN